MNLVRNERLKLFATYLNGLAIALFAVGGLAPVFSTLYGTANNSAILVAVVGVICFVVSAASHLTTSLVLKRLLP